MLKTNQHAIFERMRPQIRSRAPYSRTQYWSAPAVLARIEAAIRDLLT